MVNKSKLEIKWDERLIQRVVFPYSRIVIIISYFHEKIPFHYLFISQEVTNAEKLSSHHRIENVSIATWGITLPEISHQN